MQQVRQETRGTWKTVRSVEGITVTATGGLLSLFIDASTSSLPLASDNTY